MKRGNKIVALQDGKISRAYRGEVLHTKGNHKAVVKIWDKDGNVDVFTVKRSKPFRSKIVSARCRKKFAGWCDDSNISVFCPYFVCYRLKDLQKENKGYFEFVPFNEYLSNIEDGV